MSKRNAFAGMVVGAGLTGVSFLAIDAASTAYVHSINAPTEAAASSSERQSRKDETVANIAGVLSLAVDVIAVGELLAGEGTFVADIARGVGHITLRFTGSTPS